MNVGNLISGSFAFSKSSLYICKFMVHILLKPSLKDLEHCLANMWNEQILCDLVHSLAFLYIFPKWLNRYSYLYVHVCLTDFLKKGLLSLKFGFPGTKLYMPSFLFCWKIKSCKMHGIFSKDLLIFTLKYLTQRSSVWGKVGNGKIMIIENIIITTAITYFCRLLVYFFLHIYPFGHV